MPDLKRLLKPAAWVFYVIIVFEILFMISPFALHFYAAYGPALNFLHSWAPTAWLTHFFLPHFSETASAVLNSLHGLGGILVLVGLILFLTGAVPLYWFKFRRRGAVTGGLYRFIRHPQYVALAVVGVGTVLVWPRFLVLLTFVTMLCLYHLLAQWEEAQCLARYGETYRAYQERTGMFLPRSLEAKLPHLVPQAPATKTLVAAGLYGVLIAVTVFVGFALRDYSLSQVSASYSDRVAVLSPALLTEGEIGAAYETARSDARVQAALRETGSAPQIVYVVPLEWVLPDLPMEAPRRVAGGHHVPDDFDREHYKVFFTRARTHAPEETGKDIVKAAYGRDPIILAKVDVTSREVTALETPPPHVRWGDIPTPMF